MLAWHQCPFEATPGGRSVESWFDTIASVLADAGGTGRVADVVYDPATGHPTEMVFSGGGIDGLRVTSLGVEFAEDVPSVPDRDVESLASRCEAGFVSACYELGAAGEPLPPSLVTGNELTQAPDADVLDRCIAGEPAACHEAGARGLEGEQPTS